MTAGLVVGAGPSTTTSMVRRRFEHTLVGEALISGLVMVVLLIGVTWNLPESELKRTLTPALKPIASAAGVEQSWRMYAPEPISQLEFVEVRVTLADGEDRIWVNPRGDRVISAFAWYRWQKLKESLPRDVHMRSGVAHWAVRKLTQASEQPVRVQIVMRTELLPPPGVDGPRTTAEEILYDERLGRP
jgi:hypothetical protein